MGTYTYGEYLDTFGGVPEPGEYAPDLRELADRQRDEQTQAAAEHAPCPRCTRGTWTDSNGSAWRCCFCGGTGVVV